MPPQKCKAIILKINSYRESSCILYLFTEEYGLVHGIAKGIKRKNSCAPGLERGFAIEVILYYHPHRDMHTLGTIAVTDFFPSTRANLHKSLVRDIAFEMVLKSVSSDAPHPEIYLYLLSLSTNINTLHPDICFPIMAWKFFYDFAGLMGVAPHLDSCMHCKKAIPETQGVFLLTEQGGVRCIQCAGTLTNPGTFLPANVLSVFKSSMSGPFSFDTGHFPLSETRRIIKLLAYYCQCHFHHTTTCNSLDFMDSILPETA